MAIAEVLRRRLGGSALAALTTFALLSGVSAQSTDPNHPAPVGPGVNRGNVDNSGKGHIFYFYAGPGHTDVDMAFEEMGLSDNDTPASIRMTSPSSPSAATG
jgi:hypothetical protein